MASLRKDDVSSVKTIVDWFDSSVAHCNDTMLKSIQRMEPPSQTRRILPHSHLIKSFESLSSTWKIAFTLALCALVLLSLGLRTDVNRSRVMGAGEMILGKDEAFVPPAYKRLMRGPDEAQECASDETTDDLGQILALLGMSEYHAPFLARGLSLQTLERVVINPAKWSKLLSLVIDDPAKSSALRFAVFLVSFGPGAVTTSNLGGRISFLAQHGIDSLPACASASEDVLKPLVEAMQRLGPEEQGEYARILAECSQ
eukprot:CAMPEP_0196726206 /NCGR_PEP_ID=MMETSP1091-20130531/7535_1 /TAXON_ID=302021 /ORGANISM="Rhodomonas sp., Strain CCMP768" /LENGTH=256 /DNA_ID=CAMNT_0042068599 /DNA_START=69 /DNA_END=839 /DNA_ORIENTATION=+